jgi:hypothetical protein
MLDFAADDLVYTRLLLLFTQMGTDLQRLSWGLQQLQEICGKLGSDTGSSSSSSSSSWQPPQLYGSLFIPSKRLLAQMRFRCAAWRCMGHM